jgi:hypothetical protein
MGSLKDTFLVIFFQPAKMLEFMGESVVIL